MVWFCLHFCYMNILKVYIFCVGGKFLPADKWINLLSISVLGERYKSMWTSSLRYSDCRGSCSSFTTYISPLTSNDLWSYDVSPQRQFVTANGPEVILYLSIVGTLEKGICGVVKAQNAWKTSLNSKIERIPALCEWCPPHDCHNLELSFFLVRACWPLCKMWIIYHLVL